MRCAQKVLFYASGDSDVTSFCFFYLLPELISERQVEMQVVVFV